MKLGSRVALLWQRFWADHKFLLSQNSAAQEEAGSLCVFDTIYKWTKPCERRARGAGLSG